MVKLTYRYTVIALLFLSGAILLFSCESEVVVVVETNDESMMTEYSDSLEVIMSEDGRRSYHFSAPMMEGYSLSKQPYREFRKGVQITTYESDSTANVSAVLVANYAIYYEKQELWEAKGDVVVTKSDGKIFYFQQLFWNARTDKIYSNVDSKVVDGKSMHIAEGFESDEKFKDWTYRRLKGRLKVKVQPNGNSDSTATEPKIRKPIHSSSSTKKVATPIHRGQRGEKVSHKGLKRDFMKLDTGQMRPMKIDQSMMKVEVGETAKTQKLQVVDVK